MQIAKWKWHLKTNVSHTFFFITAAVVVIVVFFFLFSFFLFGLAGSTHIILPNTSGRFICIHSYIVLRGTMTSTSTSCLTMCECYRDIYSACDSIAFEHWMISKVIHYVDRVHHFTVTIWTFLFCVIMDVYGQKYILVRCK